MSDYSERIYETVVDIQDDKKVKAVGHLIPSSVKTIIDIGCGNGLITNQLKEQYDMLGVDLNPTKLKHVEANTLKSSCDNIPCANQSFDMVFSSELLEHLDNTLLQSTLSEFERLSKRYILITVPNKESLEKLILKCNHCAKLYHKNGHLHSFDVKKIKGLFSSFELSEILEFGQMIRGYNKGLAKLKQSLAPPDSWIPKIWSKRQGINYSFCLHCGKRNEIKHKFHPVAFGIDIINLALSRKNKSQLIALFERKN